MALHQIKLRSWTCTPDWRKGQKRFFTCSPIFAPSLPFCSLRAATPATRKLSHDCLQAQALIWSMPFCTPLPFSVFIFCFIVSLRNCDNIDTEGCKCSSQISFWVKCSHYFCRSPAGVSTDDLDYYKLLSSGRNAVSVLAHIIACHIGLGGSDLWFGSYERQAVEQDGRTRVPVYWNISIGRWRLGQTRMMLITGLIHNQCIFFYSEQKTMIW